MIWKPHAKQELFLSLPDSIFEAFYGGAAYGGKTEVLGMLPIVRGLYQYPEYKGIILRRTYGELKKEVIIRMRPYYEATGAKYNGQEVCFRWPNGAHQFFGHCENESDIRKYDSIQFNYAAFDELTSFTRFQYLYMITRVRKGKDARLPAIIRSASNPGNIGHGWARRRFVEPHVPGCKIIVDVKSGIKRIFIPAVLTDNPTGMKNDPEYEKRLDLLPEAERRAKKFGDWWSFSGQSFPEFRVKPLKGEPSYAKHVHKANEVEIPDYAPRVLAVDWGFKSMAYSIWAAALPNGNCVVYREYGRKKQKISKWGADIKKLSEGESIKNVALCQSAWQNRGQELTIARQFQNATGFAPEQSDSDRIGGKMLIHEYLKWDDGPPKLLIVNCPMLVTALGLCVGDDKRKEDVAEFDGDDPYDTLRYLLKMVSRHYGESAGIKEITGKEQAIRVAYKEDNDYQAMNFRMRKLDYERRLSARPISRFTSPRRRPHV